MRGFRRLCRIAARVRRLGRPTAIILLYHRVCRLRSDPQWLAVDAARFRMQMEVLGSLTEVVPLDRLRQALVGRARGCRPLAAITFDDGYADNIEEAAPVLQELGLPATVFATSGFVDGDREFFWDDSERLVLSSGAALPAELSLPASLGTTRMAIHDDGPGDPGWNATMPAVTARQRAYLELCRMLSAAGHEERCAALDGIRAQVGGDVRARDSHRVMTAAELRRLDASGVVTVGSHTRWHLSLARQSLAVQRDEIGSGRDALSAILDRPVRLMAYPFGTLADHGPATRRLVGDAGFTTACSNHPDPVWEGSAQLALPRFLVRDWDEAEFRARLTGFLRA